MKGGGGLNIFFKFEYRLYYPWEAVKGDGGCLMGLQGFFNLNIVFITPERLWKEMVDVLWVFMFFKFEYHLFYPWEAVKGGGGWDAFPVVRPACLTGSLLVPTEIVILKGQLHDGMTYF